MFTIFVCIAFGCYLLLYHAYRFCKQKNKGIHICNCRNKFCKYARTCNFNCLYLKERGIYVKKSVKVDEVNLYFKNVKKFDEIKKHMESFSEDEITDKDVIEFLVDLGIDHYDFL